VDTCLARVEARCTPLEGCERPSQGPHIVALLWRHCSAIGPRIVAPFVALVLQAWRYDKATFHTGKRGVGATSPRGPCGRPAPRAATGRRGGASRPGSRPIAHGESDEAPSSSPRSRGPGRVLSLAPRTRPARRPERPYRPPRHLCPASPHAHLSAAYAMGGRGECVVQAPVQAPAGEEERTDAHAHLAHARRDAR